MLHVLTTKSYCVVPLQGALSTVNHKEGSRSEAHITHGVVKSNKCSCLMQLFGK